MASAEKDWETVCAVLEGDVDTFSMLVERYQYHVVKIVSKHVPAQNISEQSHEVFVRAYRSLATYSPDKPFKHWLSVVAVRTCTDFWRVHYRRKELPASDFSENMQSWFEAACVADSESEYERLSKKSESKEALELVLGQLSPVDRMALVLTQLEEYSAKEAASLLGISTANVKVRVFRAKRTLRKLLKKYGIDEV